MKMSKSESEKCISQDIRKARDATTLSKLSCFMDPMILVDYKDHVKGSPSVTQQTSIKNPENLTPSQTSFCIVSHHIKMRTNGRECAKNPVKMSFCRRKWSWIGHTLWKTKNTTDKQAVTRNPSGKRGHGKGHGIRGWERWGAEMRAEGYTCGRPQKTGLKSCTMKTIN